VSPIGLRPLQQRIVSDWTNTLQVGRNNTTEAVIQYGRGVVAGCRAAAALMSCQRSGGPF
jgi:hypothetical protein